MATKQTREQWLAKAIKALTPLFEKHGFKVPEKMRCGVGFPRGARNAIGQAWSPKASADETHEMFISPVLADPMRVLDVLLHEMAHHVVGTDEGHKAAFKRCATLVGLTGKMTATVASEDLLPVLQGIATRLGEYPHAVLSPKDKAKKQSTRLKKMECLDCGLIIRTTDKWIDTYPVPWPCPCGGELVTEGYDDED
jgi:hypothetical protein